MTDKLPVGQVLRDLREHMGLTQTQFGRMIGIRQQSLFALESGGYTPTLPTLRRISMATGVPIWKIVRLAEKKTEVNADSAQ